MGKSMSMAMDMTMKWAPKLTKWPAGRDDAATWGGPASPRCVFGEP